MALSIRLDADLVERLKASGEGWQTRLNTVIRRWLDGGEPQPAETPKPTPKSGPSFSHGRSKTVVAEAPRRAKFDTSAVAVHPSLQKDPKP